MTDRTTFPHDTEEARLDAELTRQELGETVQELATRLKSTYQRVAVGAGAAVGVALAAFVLVRWLVNRR